LIRRYEKSKSNRALGIRVYIFSEDLTLIVVYVNDLVEISKNVSTIDNFKNHLSKQFEIRET